MAALLDSFPGASNHPAHRPFPRIFVGETAWRRGVSGLAEGLWTMASLWGDRDGAHLALMGGPGDLAVLSLPSADGHFVSVASGHPPAQRLERAMADLFGLIPDGLEDRRPWLDHGAWDIRHPLAGATPAFPLPPYAFLPTEGPYLHQIPVGPVHAGIIEPGHFRFTASGETVVRLEERLGYAHKGVDALMAGAPLDRAARLAGRVSGDSTVAYGIAFARAVEAAMRVEVPARGLWLRALMLEMERIANHLGDFGAVCNDASFGLIHAHSAALREGVLRAAATAFGHRLMMDRAVPGGVAVDLDQAGADAIGTMVDRTREGLRPLVALYDRKASLLDRTVTTGVVRPELVTQYAAGGYVGRASGRDFDARRDFPFAPYDQLAFAVPLRQEGDVNARLWIRIEEVGESLSLIEQILGSLPAGEIRSGLPPLLVTVEGMALVEGFRGDILAWLRLEGGRVARCHLRDPSWFQWPLLEAAIEGNIVADFPLINKSFNCSYSGHDL